jgi:7-cyano-7-deazaguanine synthase
MNNESRRATVLLSGGMDSAACAHFYRAQGFAVEAIFVEHGQAALRNERVAAEALSKWLDIPFRSITLGPLPQSGVGELVGRNALLISVALFASRMRAGLIGIGIHVGPTYYDCSEAFLTSINALVAAQTDGRIRVDAPFINWHKSDIYSYFRSAEIPLTLTYSCEAGTDSPCEQCASCRDRRALGC